MTRVDLLAAKQSKAQRKWILSSQITTKIERKRNGYKNYPGRSKNFTDLFIPSFLRFVFRSRFWFLGFSSALFSMSVYPFALFRLLFPQSTLVSLSFNFGCLFCAERTLSELNPCWFARSTAHSTAHHSETEYG